MKRILFIMIFLLFSCCILLQYLYEIEFPEITNYDSVRIADVDSKQSISDFNNFVKNTESRIIKIETTQYKSKIKRKIFSNTKIIPRFKTLHKIEYEYASFENLDNIRGQYYITNFDKNTDNYLNSIGIAVIEENVTIKDKITYLSHIVNINKLIFIFVFVITIAQFLYMIKKVRKYKLLQLDGFSIFLLGKPEYITNIVYIAFISIILGLVLYFLVDKSFLLMYIIMVVCTSIIYTLIHWLLLPLNIFFSDFDYRKKAKNKRNFLIIMLLGQFVITIQFIVSLSLIIDHIPQLNDMNSISHSKQTEMFSAIDLSSMIPTDYSENQIVSDKFKDELSKRNLRLDFFERDFFYTNKYDTFGELLTVNKNYFRTQHLVSASGKKFSDKNLNIKNRSILIFIPNLYKRQTGEIVKKLSDWYIFLTNNKNPRVEIIYINDNQKTESISYFQNIQELFKNNAIYCVINENEISSDIFMSLVSNRQILIENNYDEILELKNTPINKYIYKVNTIKFYIDQEFYQQFTIMLIYIIVYIMILTLMFYYLINSTNNFIIYNSRKIKLLFLEGFSVPKIFSSFILLTIFIDFISLVVTQIYVSINYFTIFIFMIFILAKWVSLVFLLKKIFFKTIKY